MMRETIADAQGEILAAVCTLDPLSEAAREAITEVALLARERMLAEDPDGLLGDMQVRALDRLHKRRTIECGHEHGELICTRPKGHLRYGRHATACGTQLWEG